jgi:predicted dithiol-disulfide oxidoreductase (DUF899 family)
MDLPPVVPASEWEAARAGLLAKEKEATRSFAPTSRPDRGVEPLGNVWALLDLTPLGRQETWEDTPAGRPQTAPYEWWRRHDEYEQEGVGS